MPTLKAEMILLGATSSVESYCLQMNARCTISEKKFVFLWYNLYIKKFHVLKKPWIGPISKKQHVNVGQTSQLLLKRVAFHLWYFFIFSRKKDKESYMKTRCYMSPQDFRNCRHVKPGRKFIHKLTNFIQNIQEVFVISKQRKTFAKSNIWSWIFSKMILFTSWALEWW